MSRQHRWTLLCVALVIAVVAVCPPQAPAVPDDVFRENSDCLNRRLYKLGRGTMNMLTGWLEVPKNIVKRWRQYDPFTGFVVGGLEGLGWGFVRTACGAYEIVMFLVEAPRDFRPLMEPEFLLPTLWGEPIPLMDPVSGLRPLEP